jgi:multiple sugar transport system substrate-binding protein
MKSPRRVVIASVAAFATVIGLAACSPGSTTSENGKVTITVASLVPGSSKDAFAAFYARVQAFEKVNKNITLKPVEYQWTGPTFASQLAGGTLPDVFNVPFTDSQSLLQAGQLADITSDVNKLSYASKFNKSLFAVASKSGHIYGVPYGPYAYGLSYNRDLFTKAGLDPNKPPTTWDEVRADAKTISDKLGIAGYMQFTSGNTGGWALTEQTYSRGGRMEVKGSDGKYTVTADNPQTEAALAWLKELRWTDNSVGHNFIKDWSGMNQYFGSGQTAMFPSGSDVLTSLVQTDGVDPANYGLALIPTEGANSGVLSGGNVATVNTKTDAAQKAAAVKWIDFYYIQKLVNKTQSGADANKLIASKQPVGVPQLPIFDKATLDTSLSWIDQYINVPKANVAPFQDGIFNQNIIAEPPRHTQELYAALDTVVQAVLTDKNADADALLKAVNKKVQALIDADTF